MCMCTGVPPPPEDINFQILTKICIRHHVFIAYRSQNCDKTVIFDFILKKKVPIFSRLRGVYGFITILGSVGNKGMIPTTTFC